MKLLRAVVVSLYVVVEVSSSSLPGCAEGERKTASTCSNYLECSAGLWLKKKCPENAPKYDSRTNTCRDASIAVCNDASSICSTPGDNIQVDGDCTSFYTCLDDGSLEIRSCPWFQRFSASSKSCDWWFKVSCSQQNKCNSQLKLPVEGSNQDYRVCLNGKYHRSRCEKGQVFDFAKNMCLNVNIKQEDDCDNGTVEPLQGNCNKYSLCENGEKVEKKCWFFERFDPETLSCDYYWNVNCNWGTECTHGDKRPTGDCREYYQCEYGYWKRRECGTSVGLQLYFDTQSKNCMIVGSTCTKAECTIDGLKREYPSDCAKYEICRKGQYYQESCGWMQKFDSERNDCRYFGVTCTASQKQPSCFDGQRKTIEGSCYSYEECKNGEFSKRYCLYPLYKFDSETLMCTYEGKCDGKCHDKEVLPIPGKCNQFYYCFMGKFSPLTCHDSKMFDVVSLTCQDPRYATCA